MDKEGKLYQDHIDTLKVRLNSEIEADVLSFIESKEASRRRVLALLSSAAVILLILSTFLILPGRSLEMEYGEKLGAMVEAYKLFPEYESAAIEEDVIYEDESIVIYLK